MSMAARDDSGGAGSDPDWLRLGEAARFLGVAQSTIRKWSDAGRVPAFYTPGGHRRYRRADLEAFLERFGPAGRAKAGPNLLLVDDDERVRALVRATLELEGYRVREAGSAEEGMSAIDEAKPDLILLDAAMPHVDGRELLRRIQDRHGAGAIPLVMFSGAVPGEAQGPGSQSVAGRSLDLQALVAQTKRIAPV
jgi:excisionase family DNA binding protein